MPVVVLATDVDTGEAVVFREGNVRDAVRASCSFPGVFPPFVWNGRRLVDGGVIEVVPVRLARELAGDDGAVLAIDCNAMRQVAGRRLVRRDRAPRGAHAGARAHALGAQGRRPRDRAARSASRAGCGPTRIPAFAAAGEEALEAGLPELRRLLGD